MLLLISAQSDSSPAHWHCSFSGAYHISLRLLPWILGWSCCLPPSFPLSCYTTSGLSFCHENAIITTPLVKPFQPLPSTFPLCSGYTTPTSPPHLQSSPDGPHLFCTLCPHPVPDPHPLRKHFLKAFEQLISVYHTVLAETKTSTSSLQGTLFPSISGITSSIFCSPKSQPPRRQSGICQHFIIWEIIQRQRR